MLNVGRWALNVGCWALGVGRWALFLFCHTHNNGPLRLLQNPSGVFCKREVRIQPAARLRREETRG
jgi:hypothetical protein